MFTIDDMGGDGDVITKSLLLTRRVRKRNGKCSKFTGTTYIGFRGGFLKPCCQGRKMRGWRASI